MDKLIWASIWLYVATDDEKYMDNVESLMVDKNITDGNRFNDHWTQCWDYVMTGVFTKLATLSPNPMYREIAEEHFDYWQMA